MSAHPMCKACHPGIGWATVELSDVAHVFATAEPRRDGPLRDQAESALRGLDEAIRAEGGRQSIIRQRIFLAQPSLIDECRQIIRDYYGADLPATSYIPQTPCHGKLLSIEVHGVRRGRCAVEIERVSEELVLVRHDDLTWAYCTPVSPAIPTSGAYETTALTLQRIRSLLHDQGFRYDQVLRTWFYLGGIVAPEGATQRYKELNRARADFYKDIPFLTDYQPRTRRGSVFPASTGIGAEGRDLTACAIALATDRDDVIATPLENPRQTSAYDYARAYSPQTPKFSRAMALAHGPDMMLFISGTASITNSESRHTGDAVAQAHETLNNIEALISEENLARHGFPGFGSSLAGLAQVRVYVKRMEDYPQVLAVCNRRLGHVAAVYTTTDVCRPELLVEIEGIAFSRIQPSHLNSVLRGPHFREVAPRRGSAARPA